VIELHKLYRIPNFENSIKEEFLKKGYGLVKRNGKVWSDCLIKENMFHTLLTVHYKVNEEEEDVIKSVIKGNEILKISRVLKYYSYSKNSKYH
jgi:hypothetical protein